MTAPETVGRYRIIRQLGVGGMGEVFLAEDSALKRLVAIKVVVPSDADDEASHARLVREAQAAATLDHPNVCAIYEVGEVDGRPFFAMQDIDGETLADRMARGQLPLHELVAIAEQVADALAQAHARAIIHRDIKPQNIMLQADRGLVKVLDFGLAKQTRSNHGATTMPVITAVGNTTAGTMAYMSPEQHRGSELAAATDIFSLGCVLHEMAGGTHPFKRASGAETIAAILGEVPLALPAATPAELGRIIRKCLEKDPQRRYATAQDLLVDLRNFARDSSAGMTPAATASRTRIRTAGIVVAVAAVVLAAAMAWTFLRPAPSHSGDVRVIAILPLHTSDASSAFLGDGISESVLNSLSQLRQIKVLARTTTFRYRGADVDLVTLRRDLKVDAVLTGTVQQQGDSLIVQAELIDIEDGSQIWGQRYSNRRLADVFAVQEEIARDIASSLRLELAGNTAAFSKRYTQDVEAYRAYVLGRASAQDRTEKGLQTALVYYRQAIGRDGRYTLAWAGVTDAYLVLAARGTLPYGDARRLAADAAGRALTLDPDLAEAHAALGQTHVYAAPFDFEAGDRALRRAIELNPGSALTRQYLAVSMLEQGRLAEAVRELEAAHDLDPLAGFQTRLLALGYMIQGDLGRALTTYRSAASLGAQFATVWEADLFVRAGAAEEGLRAVAIAHAREDDPAVRFNHAVLNAANGRTDEALRVAAEFERQAEANPFWARYAARIHLTLGDNDRGLALLSRSVQGGAMPIFYKDEPLFAPLRNDPRFRALLKEMRVPD